MILSALDQRVVFTTFAKNAQLLTRKLPVTQTVSKIGAEHRINTLLSYLFRKKDIKPDEKVIIKFAFDGARVTNKTKKSQVIGTIQLISTCDKLHEVKSSKNCHQFVIFFGDESNEDLKQELQYNLPCRSLSIPKRFVQRCNSGPINNCY